MEETEESGRLLSSAIIQTVKSLFDSSGAENGSSTEGEREEKREEEREREISFEMGTKSEKTA